MKLLRTTTSVALVALVAGCNRSDSGASSTVPAATSIAYTLATDDLRVGVEAPALVPSASGAVLEYTIAPALPAGLELDRKTGVVSGVPSAAAPFTSYTVRARVKGGVQLSATIAFEVHADFAGSRFAYTLNLAPSSVNTWRYDAGNDLLVSAAGLPVDGAPVRAVAHPLGDRLFVLDFDKGRVLTFAIDPDGGNLELIDQDPTGPFPLGLAVSNDGRFVFTGSTDRLASFRVDPVTRTLVAQAAPLFVADIAAVEVLPDSRHLAVSSTKFDAVGILAIDEDTGGYQSLLGLAPLATGYGLAVSADGARLFTASFGGNALDTFDIDPPTPSLARIDRIALPDGTFDLDLRGPHLWAAHYGAKALTRYTLAASGVPALPGEPVAMPGSAPRVRATEGGGYFAPLFDIGVAQRAGAPGEAPLFQALRPFACDLVLVPAPTSRTRSTPFAVVLDGTLASLSVLSSTDGSTVFGPVPAGTAPRALASGDLGDRVVVGDSLTGAFRRFAVEPTAPAVSPSGGATPAGFTVRDLAFDGDGRRLWVATQSQLVTFDLRGPTPVQVDQIALGTSLARLSTDPAGRFLVVTDDADDLLRILLVGPNTNDPFLGSGSPFDLRDLGDPALGAGATAFEPGGRYLLVALEAVGEVRSYEIGPINASVAFAGTVSGLGQPVDLAVAPAVGAIFVADAAAPALHLVALDPKGVPSLVDSAPLAAAPRRLVLADDGTSVQVISADGTWQRFQARGGALVEEASASTGLVDPVDFAPLTVWTDTAP